MATAAGWQKYVWFKKETTFGTAVTPDIWLPCEQYGILVQPRFYTAPTYVGIRQRSHPQMHLNKIVEGPIVCDFYGYQVTSGTLKSVAEHLISLATNNPTSLDLDSATFEMYDANDAKRHFGARVDTLSIAGSAEAGSVKLTLGVKAKQETGGITPPSLVAATPHYKPAMFADATFALSGSAATLRSFELTLNNQLVVKHNNSTWPDLITAMIRMIDFKFTLFKTANTYDALRRATSVTDITGQIVIKADHHGTALNTYTTLTIDISKMNFAGASENDPLNDIWEQNVDYVVLKPASASNDITLTWGTSA